MPITQHPHTFSDRASNWSHEMNQLDDSYDDILHHPHSQVTLSKNVAYFRDSRESNKSTDHIYDEIHEQVKAVKTEEIKFVETRVTNPHWEMTSSDYDTTHM